MHRRAFFIGATGQNVGKTTLCLGILSGLMKRYNSVGFIKPVGQQHEQVEEGVSVDKDVVLFKKQFNLQSDWKSMSPVIIPSGFTRDYLDGKFTTESMEQDVVAAFKSIAANHEITLVEGTGHVGVGSIIGMSNVQIAALLRLEMILVASGGLGSTVDELALNITLCRQWGVPIRGVILNRVHRSKRDMVLEYIPKALDRWKIPLLGSIPYHPLLSTPTMNDFSTLFQAPLIAGDDQKWRHFSNVRLVAGSEAAFEQEFNPEELIITPASREDIILKGLELMNKHKRLGFLLTGRNKPKEAITNKLIEANIPSLYAPICSYDAMKQITTLITKTRIEDKLKVDQAIDLVENSLDFSIFESRLTMPRGA